MSVESVLDIYSKEYDLINVYIYGSSSYLHSTKSVAPKDLDLVLIVSSLKKLYEEENKFFRRQRWAPSNFFDDTTILRKTHGGIQGFNLPLFSNI